MGAVDFGHEAVAQEGETNFGQVFGADVGNVEDGVDFGGDEDTVFDELTNMVKPELDVLGAAGAGLSVGDGDGCIVVNKQRSWWRR